MSGEKPILEMTPISGVDLKEWLGLALTRFALGGVTVGQVCDSWLRFPPKVATPPGFERVPEGTMALLDKISDNLDVALANAAQYDAKSWARLSADHLEMILAVLTAHRAAQKKGE